MSAEEPGEEANASAAGEASKEDAATEKHITLAKAYREAAEGAKLKVNHLVERSILQCAEAGSETWSIVAPGNDKLVFTSRLGDADVALFGKVFAAGLQTLLSLDLSYNLIGDDGAKSLASWLGSQDGQHGQLASLSLRGNAIEKQGCSELVRALKKRVSLSRFDMALNPLGREGGLMLVTFLQDSPSLLELHMADCEKDIDVLVAVSAVLLTGSHSLRVCDLSNPRIKTLQEEHTMNLGRMLRVNSYLTEIYLGKHRMRDEGVRQLVSFLLENKTLRVLDLRCNELGADGAGHLSKLLAADCQLRKLNLEGNRIGEKDNVQGAAALANALMSSNRMLSHLNLNNNGLCGAALLALGEAMAVNSTLECVELFHSHWDATSSFKFHQILNDAQRIAPLRTDFITDEVDYRIDVCQKQDFKP
eukprot:TRINITY_DN17216_c0_g1_i1.p1 TRINITY_DN17216_c0_g1~~TRINITY_DN17216_c0_g1_i1.p1  ORF type:complete len:420 (-),score=145.06 TRINITY_DN17216_c0_g1_i1:173-1432(-)